MAPAGIVFVYPPTIPVTLAVITHVPGAETVPAGILTFVIVRAVAVTVAVPVGGLHPAESVGAKAVT
jgi:hypothetical protein